MASCFLVLLQCGHWFRESRPSGMLDPHNGETRVCAHPDHYPQRYPAQYLVETAGFSLFDLPITEHPPLGALEEAFSKWFDEKYPSEITTTAKGNLLNAWKAALRSVELDR